MGIFGGGDAPKVERNTLKANAKARVLDVLCEGPINGLVGGLRGIIYNDTPYHAADGRENFNGVSVEVRYGTANQAPLGLIPTVESLLEGLPQPMKKGVFVTRRITDPSISKVRIRVLLPDGLFRLDNSGDQRSAAVSFEIWIGSDGRDPSRYAQETIDGKTMSPFPRDYEITLPGRAPWTVALLRISSDSTSNGNDQQTNWTTTWDACTLITGARMLYPNTVVIAQEFDSSKFGQTLPTREFLIDGFCECLIPTNYDPQTLTYDGLWDGRFRKAFTENPAWCLYTLIVHKRFGLGHLIPEGLIDKWSFYEAARFCDERVPDGYGGTEPRFQCSIVLDQQRPVFDVLNDFASIFRGLVYYAAGGISVVADQPRDPVAIITPANVVDGVISYSEASKDARHSVVTAMWRDPSRDYKMMPETEEDGEMMRRYGWRRKTVTAFAAKTRGQARRVARWIIATEKWESGVAKFQAGIELAWLKPGDIVALADQLIAGDRLGGRLRAINETQVALDAKVTFTPGDGYWILIVMPDGSVARRQLVDPDLRDDLVELYPPLDQLPVDGAMFAIEGTDVTYQQYRIINIAEDEDHLWSFDCVRYERHKQDWIEKGVAFEPDRYSRWSGPLGAPEGLIARGVLYRTKAGVAARLEFSWSPSLDPRVRQFEVQVLDPGSVTWRPEAFTQEVSIAMDGVPTGTYSLRVRAVADFYEPSPWALVTYAYGGLADPPPDVDAIWASQMNDMLYLQWTPVAVLDLDHYELRGVGQDDQPVWERGNVISRQLPPKSVSISLPLVPGIYMIKAVDTGGNLSANPAHVRVTSDLTLELIYDALLDKAPWDGAKVGTTQLGTDLLLVRQADNTFAGTGTYVLEGAITQVPATTVPLRFAVTMAAVGRDPENVIASWRPIASAKPLGGVVSDKWSVFLEVALSSDGTVYGDYQTMGFGYFNARAYKFRATLTTDDNRITPAVQSLLITAFKRS